METSATGQVRARCVLTIADSGSGMPEAVRNHIFDPFYTTKDTGEGTGLGLYISYGIITGHGGSIGVASREGEGTTFTIKLPKKSISPDLQLRKDSEMGKDLH